jgi:hypothetical protein
MGAPKRSPIFFTCSGMWLAIVDLLQPVYQPSHKGIADARASPIAAMRIVLCRQTFKKVTSYTKLGIVRTLKHCCTFVTRPIVRPTPKWRIGFGDSMTTVQKPPSFLGAFLSALGYLCFGGCAWETLGSAGFTIVRFANPRTATTLLFGDDRVVGLPPTW